MKKPQHWYAAVIDEKKPYYVHTPFFKSSKKMLKYLKRHYNDIEYHYFLYITTSEVIKPDPYEVCRLYDVIDNNTLHNG